MQEKCLKSKLVLLSQNYFYTKLLLLSLTESELTSE